MSRRPNRDLPAIPEVSTPNEIDGVDDDNTIESYAFTLDGVGFDEESGSILQTPNSMLTSPDRLGITRRDEIELHAQTCRTLGIPYSAEMNTGSPRESVESTSTGSATVRGNVSLYDVPLERLGHSQENKDASPRGISKSKQSRRLITRAKIAKMTSSYANSIKDLALAFSAKSKNLYANSKPKFLTQDGGQVYKSAKKPSFNPSEWYPAWIKDANPLTKLAVAVSFFFVTLLITVVVVVSNSNNGRQTVSQSETNLIDAGRLSSALNDTALGSINTMSESQAITSMPSYLPTISPTVSQLSLEESNSCVDNPGKYETSRGKDRACTWLQPKHLDRECGGGGKSPTELGLNCKFTCREYNGCDIITMDMNITESPSKTPTVKTAGTPTNKPTKRERRKNKTPSPTVQSSSTDIGPKNSATAAAAAEDEEQYFLGEDEEEYFLDTESRLRPCPWLDIPNTTQRNKRREANCNKDSTHMICPTSCADFVKYNEAAATSTLSTATPEDEEEYFLDSDSSRLRTCAWLDILNKKQQIKRREANCMKESVYMLCPASCADYVQYDEAIITPTPSTAAAIEEDTEASFSDNTGKQRPCSWLDIRNPTLKAKRRDDNCDKVTVQIICSSSCKDYAIPITVGQMKEDALALSRSNFERTYDLVPQGKCFDTPGYFLNEQGHVVKCSWLTEDGVGAKEIELRKGRNCGKGHETTDLGNMCKSSCGTC